MRMRILIVLLVSCVILGVAHGQAADAPSNTPRTMSAPALPYLDQGACPFEGCAYREWTARKSVIVYDSFRGKRLTVARLDAGEKVTALTGVVITFRPGVIRMDRDLLHQGLRRGDTILTYTYQGEGVSSAWIRGRFYREMDLSFAKGPNDTGCRGQGCAGSFIDPGKHTWWAQIRTGRGITGWVLAEGNFDGQDLLAQK